MKQLLIALIVIVGIVAVAVAALPFILTGNFVAEKVAAAVKERTGRDLTLRINSLSLFPDLKARVESATLSDVPDSGRPAMLELGPTEFEVALWPLLRGTVQVDRLTVDGLRANLLVDAAGRPNWEFGRESDQVANDAPQPASQEPLDLPDIQLGDVRLGGVEATYKDEGTGQTLQVADGALAVSMPNLDMPAELNGDAKVNNRALVLKARVESPRALAEQRPTTVQGQISSDLFNASLEARPEADGRTGGPLSVSVPDLRAMTAWLGMPNAESLSLRSVNLTGKATIGSRNAQLDEFQLALDDIKANGSAAADWSGRIPAATVRTSVAPVDLNRFIPPAASQPASPSASPSAGWSDEPIDVSALRRMNLDAVIESQGLLVRNIKFGPSRTTLRLQDGILAADASEVPVLGGRTSTALRIDATRQPAGYALKASSEGIQAELVLAALAGTDRLRGTVSLNADLAAVGTSQKAVVSGLNGTTRIVLRNGALRGVNIAAILRDPVAAATGRQQGITQETDFAEFGGTFRLDGGVARTGDLHMLAPLFRMDGEGTVSLADRRLDLRLNPKATATLQGQGGQFDRSGLTIPILVTGTFDAPSIQPDFSGVVLSAIKDPAKAAEAVRRLKEGGSPADILGGLTGAGGKDGGSSGARPAAPEAGPLGNVLKGPLEQGVKGLFGR